MKIEIEMGAMKMPGEKVSSLDDLRRIAKGVDPEENEYSKQDLDACVEILDKAEQIKADKMLYDTVRQHMKEKTKTMKSLDDLRSAAVEKSLED